MTYATDPVQTGNEQTVQTIRRGLLYLTVVAIAMIAAVGGALAALGA